MEETSEKVWQKFIESHQGEFSNKGNQIFYSSFKKEELLFSFSTYKKGLNSKSNIRTQVSCKLPSVLNLEFKIRHQGLFNKLFMLFGMQDIKIDDQYFDDNFVIQGNNEKQVILLLQSESIRNFLPKSYELIFELKENTLKYRCRGLISETSMLESLMTLMNNTVLKLKELDF